MSSINHHVLVVEDNAENQQLITWILEDAEYTVSCADSAEQGMALIEKNLYDAVLMDISLPGIDGKAATMKLRENPDWKHLPIIALTAHGSDEDKAIILASGVNDVVTKPVDEDRLLAILAELSSPEGKTR